MDTTAVSNVPSFGIFEQLANYGALGIVVIALGAAAWFFIKRNMDEKERLQNKIDELEKELRNRK